MSMRSPAAYRAAILASLHPTPVVDLELVHADGCVLAEDVISSIELPQFDNSAMDGYAIRAADVLRATAEHPVRLRVLGDIVAGASTDHAMQSGAAWRIMTGAPMPMGADTVVKVEDTDGGVDQMAVFAPAEPGRHIRRAGEDILRGQVVLAKGAVLGARQIGLAAAVGRGSLPVHRQPTIVVIPTGSELTEPGAELRPGAIYDSNGPMIGSAVRATGAEVRVMQAVPDEIDAFADALRQACVVSDLIVTIGGVSMGAYDTVKAVLSATGGVHFEKVAMSPGKPQGFGFVGPDRTPIITLPGNPVSAFVSFECFVRPAIRLLQGHRDLERPRRRARVTADLTSTAGKEHYLRATLTGDDELSVEPSGIQGSHVMGGLGVANALIVIPANQTTVSAGESVEVIDLRMDG